MEKINTIEGIMNLMNTINSGSSTITKVYENNKTLEEILNENGIDPTTTNVKTVTTYENGKKITTCEFDCPETTQEFEINFDDFIGKGFTKEEMQAFFGLVQLCLK